MKRVKKVNILFVLECAIIVLLLAILGVLLKGSTTNEAKEAVMEEQVAEENVIEEQNHEKIEVGSSVSGIVNVADIVADNMEGNESVSFNSISGNHLESVSGNSVSDNQVNVEPPVENINVSGKFMDGKKIVVFGDSIWNASRGADGISEYVQEDTGAIIYNCAVGGSAAALVNEENSMENWNSNSFNGMVYVARKLVSAEKVLKDLPAYDVIKQVDFNEMDYVIVAYGLNDFFSSVPVYPKEYYDIRSYIGALRNGIKKLQENYPHLKIIVVSPTYTKMFEGERQYEIGTYVEAARSVASEMGVEFLDMFHVLGSNAESRTQHLGDGVHMSAEGRKVYADAVTKFLKEIEMDRVG